MKRFRDLSLIQKFIIPNIIILIILIALVAWISYFLLEREVKRSAGEILENGYKVFTELVEEKESTGLAVAYLISQDPDVKKAFRERNRKLLYKYVKVRADLELLTGVYDLRLHFIVPLAISFFRTWNPERFGIDVSKFRRTLVTVARTRTPQRGIEVGLRRVLVTGVYPVVDGDEYLGAVELITPFKPILDNLKDLTGIESIILIERKAAAHSEWILEAKEAAGMFIYYETNPVLRNLLLTGLNSPETVLINQNYAVVAKPIYDFSRRKIGYLILGYDIEPVISSYKQLGLFILTLVVLAAFVSFGVSYFIFKKYVEEPINELITHTERISMGEVDQKIPIKSKDEIGKLAEAFERMRVSIKKVMDLLK